MLVTVSEEFKVRDTPQDPQTVLEQAKSITETTWGRAEIFKAIAAAIDQFSPVAIQEKTKLVLVVATGTSGGDDSNLEQLIRKCKECRIKVLCFAQPAGIGGQYSRAGTSHGENEVKWYTVEHGTDEPAPECVQWDVFRPTPLSAHAGFGPYALSRLIHRTYGLVVLTSVPQFRKADSGELAPIRPDSEKAAGLYDRLALLEYAPDYVSNREYEKQRQSSPFRRGLFEVIQRLDPERDRKLIVSGWNYPSDPDQFQKITREDLQRVVYSLSVLRKARAKLDEIRAERAKESSMRWRAGFDMSVARCAIIEVRLHQFLLALDEPGASVSQLKPVPEQEHGIRLALNDELRVPTSSQWDRLKGLLGSDLSLEEFVERQQTLSKNAGDSLDDVIKEHPGTPWAELARRERSWGQSIRFVAEVIKKAD